ncbi:MAG: glycosyltransferase [Candidatus Competibacteraceae bacterium]
MADLIVFSHLRWNFVYQRPQHLMTRLARHYRVTFIEEPIFHESDRFLEIQEIAPNIRVARPHTSIHAPGFHDDQLPDIEELVESYLLEEGIEDYIAWLYTPMALPLLRRLEPSAIIYDCMDELAAFKNAPRQLLQRESALLKMADLVFTGGPSLYRGKRDRHPAVYCFPSSVDSAHFGRALTLDTEHPVQQNLPRPRLGFYGVIDERFDLDLLSAVASARPEWQLVMVGPVVKIDNNNLPRHDNIHYPGQRSYEELPQFLAGWDVCLLPFALNEATRFISPTKTLEYMAAELPIVSTPITDVAEPYGHIVHIAHEPAAFIAACERALAETEERAAERKEKMRAVLANTSWDNTAVEMCMLIERARARSRAVERALLRPSPAFIASKRSTEQTPVPQRKLRLRTA